MFCRFLTIVMPVAWFLMHFSLGFIDSLPYYMSQLWGLCVLVLWYNESGNLCTCFFFQVIILFGGMLSWLIGSITSGNWNVNCQALGSMEICRGSWFWPRSSYSHGVHTWKVERRRGKQTRFAKEDTTFVIFQ